MIEELSEDDADFKDDDGNDVKIVASKNPFKKGGRRTRRRRRKKRTKKRRKSKGRKRRRKRTRKRTKRRRRRTRKNKGGVTGDSFQVCLN